MKDNRVNPIKPEVDKVKLRHIEEDIAMLDVKFNKILEERASLVVKLIATRERLTKG